MMPDRPAADEIRKRIHIRHRVIWLILIMAVLIVAERAHSLFSERQAEIDRATSQLKAIAQIVALTEKEAISSATAVTQALSMQAQSLLSDPESCGDLLKRIASEMIGVQGGMITDAAGVVRCASVRALLGIDLSDRPYMREARTAQRAVLSDFLVARSTGRPTFAVTEAQRDASGEPIAFAGIALDLQWISRLAAQVGAQAGAVVTVLDSTGIVLARHPATSGTVGAPYRNPETLAHLQSQDEGTLEGRGLDGSMRMFAFLRIPGTGLRVLVSRDKDAVVGAIDRRILATMASLLVAIALFMALALAAAHRLIVAPLNRLAADVLSVGRGEATAIGEVGVEEIHPVLEAYTEMSARLQERAAELRNINGRLAAIASTDGLTGLANRRTFDVQFSEDWVRCADTGRPLALIMADVDNFKLFNDSMGHPAGDEVLREVARMVAAAVAGPGRLVARYGGEEFIVLLPDTDAASAIEYAETARRLVVALDIPHPKVPMGRLTASFGVAATLPRSGEPPDSVLAAADAALYEAKRLGRNRVVGGRVAQPVDGIA
ncbi:diguanylate cyclase [Aquabacter cavernae]|uniref:GGDEF domain-containing protein n=1 Tax=Aquabacter cavernae TaxID=2496029 RepID=UPI0013E03D40|nr:diguanylate cyclase [Aquabacter cavernae]